MAPFPPHATAFDESLTFDSCDLRLWKCELAWLLDLNDTRFVLGVTNLNKLTKLGKYKYDRLHKYRYGLLAWFSICSM